ASADGDAARVQHCADRGDALSQTGAQLVEELDGGAVARSGELGDVLAGQDVRVTAAAFAQGLPEGRRRGDELAGIAHERRAGGEDLEAARVATAAARTARIEHHVADLAADPEGTADQPVIVDAASADTGA